MPFDLDIEQQEDDEEAAFTIDPATMHVTVSVMHRLGMITHTDPPPWPVPEDYGTTKDDVVAYLIEDGAGEVPEAVQRFDDALHARSEAAADKPDGIPCYKLSSHDGWLITPEEITAALGWWTITPPDAQQCVAAELEWWPGWLRYLKDGREHGGIRVW